MGKLFFLVDRIFFLSSGLAVSGAALIGCTTMTDVVAGRPSSVAGDRGRWIGSVRPSDDACGGERTGVMVIGADSFAFDPFQGSLSIRGARGDADLLVGSVSGGAAGSLSLNFAGNVVTDAAGEQRVTGVLTSSRCRWQVELHRG